MKRRISTIFIALSLCMLLAASVSADVLYTAQATFSDPPIIGTIIGTNSPTKVAASTIGTYGQRIASFTNASGSQRVALSLYNAPTGDTVWIYDPAVTDYRAPLKEVKNDNLSNIRAMVSKGSYLYGIDYDNGNVSRFDTTGDAYTPESTKYTYTPVAGHTTPGEVLVTYGDHLYAVFSDSTYTQPVSPNTYGTYTYYPSHLVKLNADLSVAASADIQGKNVNGMGAGVIAQDGNKLYVVSNGDGWVAGSFNATSMIEEIDLDTMTSTKLISASDIYNVASSDWNHNLTAITIAEDKVYVQALSFGDYPDYVYNHRVYETTIANLGNFTSWTLVEQFDATAYGAGMAYDSDTKLLWANVGKGMYRYDGKTWVQYTGTQLGGNIACQFAIVPANTPTPTPEPGGSSGGCNAGFAGLLLLALIPVARFGRKKK